MLMKKIVIFIILLCTVRLSFGQSDKMISYCSSFDSFSPDQSITHLWVGQNNPLSVSTNIIKIWSDNAEITKESGANCDYYVKLLKKGRVNIYYSIKNSNSKSKFDGLISFEAIIKPDIITIVDSKRLVDSSDISYSFYFKKNNSKVNNEDYQLCSFPGAIIVLNSEGAELGSLFPFSEKDEIKRLLANGHVLRIPPFPLRDMKTNLVVWTASVDYKLK